MLISVSVLERQAKSGTPSRRLIKTLEGYQAFYSSPLPPRITWTEPLAIALANASVLVDYGGLRGISERGNWNGWLQFFLNGIARQAEDGLSRAERMNALLTQWRVRRIGSSHQRQEFQTRPQGRVSRCCCHRRGMAAIVPGNVCRRRLVRPAGGLWTVSGGRSLIEQRERA